MIVQPSRGDGEDAWREYAGALRRQLAIRRRSYTELKQRLEKVQRESSKRNGLLNWLHRQLRAGDYPAAVDRLERRAAAKARR